MLKVSASEIWKKDELRLNKLYSMGYTVKVIWELDVTRNIDGIIKECCDFIKG
jgi:very-short-patch-repair endonuclease